MAYDMRISDWCYVVCSSDLDQADAQAAQGTASVESNQGKVTKTETWGLKSLAYKIDRNCKAHFVLLNIDASGPVIQELERQTRINEDVIRYMTVRVDAHGEGSSARMRNQDRERTGGATGRERGCKSGESQG